MIRTHLPSYMLHTREERRAHLDLNESCDEGLGCRHEGARVVLAMFLRTTAEKIGWKACVCHACHNKKCANPKHLYWGTQRDNAIDMYENDPDVAKRGAATRRANNPNAFIEMPAARKTFGNRFTKPK